MKDYVSASLVLKHKYAVMLKYTRPVPRVTDLAKTQALSE